MATKLDPKEFITIGQSNCNTQKVKLIAIGMAPVGYISIGVTPMGILTIGIVPMGVISFGVVAMGAIASGLVSMGVASFGLQTMSLLNLGRWQVGTVEIKSEPHHHNSPSQPSSNLPHQH